MAAPLEFWGTVLFGLALLHVFSVKRFQALANRFPEGSPAENLFHLLGEVEVVFGFWTGLLLAGIAFYYGKGAAIAHVEALNFTEPAFVFVIMTIAATSPILRLANGLLSAVTGLVPLPRSAAYFATVLVLGPLLGSLITEPAAMTVTALLLKERYFDKKVPASFQYAVLAVLFVNVSIGGVLSAFAAPPVLMVAREWQWDNRFMLQTFGWKAALAVIVNAGACTALYWKTLIALPKAEKKKVAEIPWWLVVIHVAFLALVVASAHHPVFFLGAFLYFLGVVQVTKEYQEELKLKESLLVAFFLGGLVVLGSFQSWWLSPLLPGLSPGALFSASVGLTAVLDNAALTYLGAQVPNDLSEALKYALVAGAVAGGGLTVLANAPNPAGFAILRPSFGKSGISPIALFLFALPPTLVAMICLWFL